MLQVEFRADKPSVEKENQAVKYTEIELLAHVQFSKPSIFYIHYPIVVMNELLPPELLIHDVGYQKARSQGRHPNLASDRFISQNYFSEHKQKHSHVYWPKLIPFYDDWKIPIDNMIYREKYRPFIQAAFTLDTVDPENPLSELTDFTKIHLGGIIDDDTQEFINPKVLKVIELQGHHSFYYYVWYNITVFKDEYILEQENIKIEIDPENGLTIVVPKLERSRFYHVVFSEIMDKSKVSSNLLDWDSIIRESDSYDLWASVGRGELVDGVGSINTVWDLITEGDLHNATDTVGRILQAKIIVRKNQRPHTLEQYHQPSFV
jgi:hypothetical protein